MRKLVVNAARCAGLIFCLLFAVPSFGQTQVRQMEGVTEYRLANGLQVLLAPNDLHARVYANLVVKAGSAVEGFGEGGMAHLLEHLVFKGTPNTRDPMKAFSDRSLNFNGTTNIDRTNYFASMNPESDKLNWYLGWLADASMNSFIAKADLDKEMTVVRNEFERAGGSPERAVYNARMALAFPNHGYGRPTIGNRADIENVNIERLQAFYKTWYRPDNMVLVVAGRFDTAATLAHIQSVFGVLKNPNTPLPAVYTREPVQDGIRGTTIRRVGEGVSTLIGWRGAPRAHRDDAALDVVANTLANNGGGRFKDDIEKQSLGSQVWAGHSSYLHYGLFDVGLRVKGSANLDTVQSLLLKHIADIARTGVTPEELQRTKNTVFAQREQTKRSADDFGALLADSVAAGDWRLGFWYDENLSGITVEDTKRVAQEYLVDANRVRVSFVPEDKPIRAVDAAPVDLKDFVAKPVVPQKSDLQLLERFEPTIVEIDKRTVRADFPNGPKLALLARPAAGDAIAGTLRLHWGNLDSMRGQSVAPYVGTLLLKGTKTRTEAQIKDALDQLQSKISIYSGTDGMTVDFTTTRQNWSAFAKLMQDVIRNPAFDDAMFKIWQQEAISAARKELDVPEAKAINALRRGLAASYAKDDPRYQPTPEENIERWQALKLDDIKRFWAQFANADVAEFAAAGALDVDVVKQDVAIMLAGWSAPNGVAPYQRIAKPLFAHPAKTAQVPTPDKPNGLTYAAYAFALEPWSRESIAMTVANGILGGSAASRLYTKVRKEEGLSYSVGSYLNMNPDDKTATFGYYGIYAPSNKAKFDAATQAVFDDVRAKGLSSLELFAAKRVAADQIKQSMASDRYMAGEMATALRRVRNGETRNAAWYEQQQAIVQSLTIDELDAAAKKLMDFSRLVQINAGDYK